MKGCEIVDGKTPRYFRNAGTGDVWIQRNAECGRGNWGVGQVDAAGGWRRPQRIWVIGRVSAKRAVEGRQRVKSMLAVYCGVTLNGQKVGDASPQAGQISAVGDGFTFA